MDGRSVTMNGANELRLLRHTAFRICSLLIFCQLIILHQLSELFGIFFLKAADFVQLLYIGRPFFIMLLSACCRGPPV